ncbi:MAG: hypothetical protein IJT32_06910 [Lachnospiraceae bacterium]|nr:hypothetical protein [Lachnospiraceae bacterium]
MKTKRMITAVCAVALAVMLGGCGEVPLIELTAEEENIVTLYAAKVMAKHNVRLAQGLVRYKGAVEEETLDEPVPASDTPEDASQEGEGQMAQTADGSAASTPASDAVTAGLNEIFGIGGVDISYAKAAFENDYVYNNYYHLTPDEGNCYLVMYFNVANTTDGAIDVDLYSLDPVFRAIADGSSYGSETTILPNDLATYLTTIEGKGTDTAVLLFEVPASGSKDVNAVGLQVAVNGTTYNVPLQ